MPRQPPPESMSVSSLWRYPVKTMQGETLATALLGSDGLPGDRGWALRDEIRGAITGGRHFGRLMEASARYRSEPAAGAEPGPVDITFPDGTTVGSDDGAVDEALSGFLDSAVTLWPRRPASDKAHYRRPLQTPWAAIRDLAGLMGIERGDALPRFHRLPPTLIRNETLPGTYFDAAPLLIVSTATLDALSRRLPESRVDVRRFRPNIVLEVDQGADEGSSEWPEQAWIGRRLRIGDCVVKVTSTCPRCVMTTRAFDDLPQDREILRTIAREMQRNVGVYATVETAGEVHAGDAATLV